MNINTSIKKILPGHSSEIIIDNLTSILSELAPSTLSKILQDDNVFIESLIDSIQARQVLSERDKFNEKRKENDHIFEYFVGKNSRLLELGASSAFPLERVAAFLNAPVHESGGYSEFIRLDYDEKDRPDVVASCFAMPFTDESFDHIRSNSLLEHVSDPVKTFEECFRVLAPGGVVQHTVPLMFPIHPFPRDYVRLAPDFFEENFLRIGYTDIYISNQDTAGRIYTCLNFLNSFDADDREAKSVLNFLKLLLAILSDLDYSDKNRSAVSHSIYVRAKKPGNLKSRDVRDPSIGSAIYRKRDSLADPLSKQKLSLNGDILLSDAGKSRFNIIEDSAYLRESDRVSV